MINFVILMLFRSGTCLHYYGNFRIFSFAEKYKIPIVVSGFEPADLLQAIYHAVLQLEKGEHKVENCYERLVKEEGNIPAQKVVNEIFEVGEQEWRGIGVSQKVVW
jgi:hydrogenase expression/formation protein HypD